MQERGEGRPQGQRVLKARAFTEASSQLISKTEKGSKPVRNYRGRERREEDRRGMVREANETDSQGRSGKVAPDAESSGTVRKECLVGVGTPKSAPILGTASVGRQ